MQIYQGKIKKKISVLIVGIFLFTTLSGAVRKWVFPDNNAIGNILLFIQLLIPFSFILFLPNNQVVSPFSRFRFLYVYLFVLILFALNPMNLTIYHGVLGLILHTGFWLMIFFYFSNRELFDEQALFKAAIVFCIIQVILGSIQYNLPDTHFINRYADLTAVKAVAKVGDKVRITGTFSYLGGIASFMLFYALLIWAMLRRGKNNQLIVILMTTGLVLSFMTGSRGTTYTYVFVAVLMILSEFKRSAAIRKLLLQLTLFVVALMFVEYFLGDRLGLIQQANTAWDTFNGRVQMNRGTGEEEARFTGPIEEVIYFNGKYPLLGVGLGAAYQGATSTFGTSSYIEEFGYYEGEWTRIILEGGFVLFGLRIFLYVLLFKNLKVPILPRLLLVLYFFSLPIIINIYNSIYLFLGIVILDKTYYLRETFTENDDVKFKDGLAKNWNIV